jgi:hypothetical protein
MHHSGDTHCIAGILDLLTLSYKASENIGTLLLRFEGDALTLLQASRTVFKDGGTR